MTTNVVDRINSSPINMLSAYEIAPRTPHIEKNKIDLVVQRRLYFDKQNPNPYAIKTRPAMQDNSTNNDCTIHLQLYVWNASPNVKYTYASIMVDMLDTDSRNGAGGQINAP